MTAFRVHARLLGDINMNNTLPVAPYIEDMELIPYVGNRYIKNGSSIICGSIMETKPDIYFTDDDFIVIADSLQKIVDSITPYSNHEYQPDHIFHEDDFPDYENQYAYKFMTEETWEKYANNGSFLFSSLERFRDMEGQGNSAGDRFEGICHCLFRT
ncbi:hypothetical protein, partial [Methylobacterium bullatum]|uniref:hypothetical protein n=1 Tax=Methylobacterium bullatum TaxID=570505 RepID=UPI0030D2C9B1